MIRVQHGPRLISSLHPTGLLLLREPETLFTPLLGQTGVSAASAALMSWAALPDWARLGINRKSVPHLVTLVPGQGSGTDPVEVVGLLPGPGTETQQVHSEPGSSPLMTPL